MLQKKNIFVLIGGRSSEFEISLISGREVIRNINKSRYNIFPIVISKDGKRWQLTSSNALYEITDPLKYKGTTKEINLSQKKIFTDIKNIPQKPDIVFIVMHGSFGEDGTVQGMLELAGLKYTGSGVLSSALGMNKLMFKKIMIQDNIPVPRFTIISSNEPLSNVKNVIGNPPYFVKPNNQGSSIGTSIVHNIRNLKKSLNLAWRYSKYALVEEYIKGKELTCSVLGNENPTALPIIEIIPTKSDYFDYNSKYSESGSEEIVPAHISKKLTIKIQKISLKVFKSIGCRGFARVDIMLRNNTDPVVLEINTIPGLTPMSLFPKAARSAGISYPELIDKIIKYANE